MNKPVTLYTASAGAGKTHTLTQEYIKLILKDEEAYKHVLAVTFTNKATDEMKQRILLELHKMASETDSAQGQMARKVLVKILHDYPAFSVSTIDRFFQSVMRAFARELGRMVTYSVELDEAMVRSQAVDNMFADLDKSENAHLLEWLIEFSLSRIEKGESWKINNEISELAKSLFSEKFKVKSGDMAVGIDEQMELVQGLKRRIASIISDFEGKCREIGRKALQIMEDAGLDYTDFIRGATGPFSLFNHLANGNRIGEELKESFLKCEDNVGGWYAKGRKGDAYKFEAAFEGGLNDMIGALVELYKSSLAIYRTAQYVGRDLDSLAILGRVYSYILEYCKEKNVVLLSETTELLSKIIDGNDTPFVYEKVGTWINNFMLDEFQDTSLLQWKNFVPLLANSISNGESNLIVGDIKQSIYRFRNSDWSILQKGIEEAFPGKIYHQPLKKNWRSATNIIEFNNNFFEAAARSAAEVFDGPASLEEGAEDGVAAQIPQIYSNFAQEVSPNSYVGGYVNVNFIDKSLIEEPLSYEDIVLAHLLDTVRRLLAQGYCQKDIGILVRYNYEGALVAKALMEADPSYRVISADSLYVSSSAAVCRIVDTLRWLDDPDNISVSVYEALKESGTLLSLVDSQESERIRVMPLYQMCEEIIRCCLTDDQRSDMTFIQSFLDMVLEYSSKEGSNLSGFLKWWNERGAKKSISSPQNQDAFQVMTVHKSKGLDFEVVVLPFFNCRLDGGGNGHLIWSTAASEVLGYNGPLPVRYLQGLGDTLFADDYLKEKLEFYIDNLNIAYVAFTRPRKELVVIAEKPATTKKGVMQRSSVAHLLYEYLTCTKKTVGIKNIKIGEYDFESEEFIVGEPVFVKKGSDEGFGWFNLGRQFEAPLNMQRLKTSLQSGSINEELSLRDNGIIMHDIFETINTIEDIESVEDVQLRKQVREMVASVADYGWFSKEFNILKECTIIRADGSKLRPDRVLVNDDHAIVVDYKFGEYQPCNKKYHKQVQRYMQLLMDMGFTRVEGYLWYPLAGEVEQIP